MNAITLPEACFFYVPFKVSSSATSFRKPFLIHLVEIHLPPVSLCSAGNSAAALIAFYLVFTAPVPMAWVFPENQDQSCSSLCPSLGLVPRLWEALRKYSQN